LNSVRCLLLQDKIVVLLELFLFVRGEGWA